MIQRHKLNAFISRFNHKQIGVNESNEMGCNLVKKHYILMQW